ncbi:hypothetical protein [Steroidobacter cummioxidans]|nr:hypothetical protein [Steroidobacter cummioxidans]
MPAANADAHKQLLTLFQQQLTPIESWIVEQTTKVRKAALTEATT